MPPTGVDIALKSVQRDNVNMGANVFERRRQQSTEAVENPSPLQTAVDRGTETLKSVLSHVGSEHLKALQVTINEVEFLVRAAQLAASTITHLDPTEQKLQQARLRGLKRIVELRKAAEPTLETGEVCELLGVTRETIRKKVDRHQLFALPKGGDRVFPAFQFKEGAVLGGIPEILEALDTDSAFTVLSFLLSRNPDLDNKTAIELLNAGDVEPVITEARGFLQHGA
jgi:excisionase family DNA binding protein